MKPILIVVVVLSSLRSAVADWNDVPTGSIKPTILQGDRIFVNKLAYDLRLPFTSWCLIEWAEPSGLPLHILLNKADKLGKGAQGKVLAQVRKAVKGARLTSVQVFSASSGQGLPELVSLLEKWLTVSES